MSTRCMSLLVVLLCLLLAMTECFGALTVEIVQPTGQPTIGVDQEQTFEAIALVDGQELESEDVDWEWDFGDGTDPVTDNPAVHAFESAGAYFVLVEATYQGLYGSALCSVTVSSATGGGVEYELPELGWDLNVARVLEAHNYEDHGALCVWTESSAQIVNGLSAFAEVKWFYPFSHYGRAEADNWWTVTLTRTGASDRHAKITLKSSGAAASMAVVQTRIPPALIAIILQALKLPGGVAGAVALLTTQVPFDTMAAASYQVGSDCQGSGVHLQAYQDIDGLGTWGHAEGRGPGTAPEAVQVIENTFSWGQSETYNTQVWAIAEAQAWAISDLWIDSASKATCGSGTLDIVFTDPQGP